jgi:ribosomal protein S1
MDYLKYVLWPALKVRLRYWWWIVKYRGKRNIPKEVVFDALTKSLERMNENLMAAYREMPEDMSDEDKKLLFESLQKGKALEGEIDRLKDDSSE